jgi:hypothetical protein
MNNLHTIANDNLQILVNLKNNNVKYNRLYLKPIENETEECEKIVDVHEIDHIIYFTFHQLLLKISFENYIGSRFKQRKQLIRKMDTAIDNIYTHFSIEESSKVDDILHQIQDIIDNIQTNCSYSMIDSMNQCVWFVFEPVFDCVKDIQEKYTDFYHAYNYICYRDNLESLNYILQMKEKDKEKDKQSDDESDKIEKVNSDKVDKSTLNQSKTYSSFWSYFL